jgi:predicted nucleotidyltransferase
MIASSGLSARDLDLIRDVLARHREVTGAILFGSRAKGSAHPASDVDLVLEGDMTALQAESIAGELDELPLPYRFDVRAAAGIQHAPLVEHIARVGVRIHP